MNEIEKKTISLINLIIMIANRNQAPTLNENLSNSDDYISALNKLKKEYNINIRIKHSINKKLGSISLPAILFNHDGEPFILAKYDEQRVLIQKPYQETPEIIDKAEFINLWSGRWIKIKQKNSQFNIRWFIPEFVSQKKEPHGDTAVFFHSPDIGADFSSGRTGCHGQGSRPSSTFNIGCPDFRTRDCRFD
ncbi:hypothetical protein LH67_01210 [Xenorhabdus nematophila]|nr:cysteine peptidase family C39 domain-containing protein [Xenorhabdus nematophila]KHD29729.1 hypothetical protein LH67_01210 [Xenorhabdus nematophila]